MTAWRPASGYTTKSGRAMWRVWDDDAPRHEAQLNDARGAPRLYRTMAAAQAVADALNFGLEPGEHLTEVARRLMAGATIMKTTCEDAARGAFYVFTDDGRTARADIVERLMAAGKLRPRGDGLFPDDSQTWALTV